MSKNQQNTPPEEKRNEAHRLISDFERSVKIRNTVIAVLAVIVIAGGVTLLFISPDNEGLEEEITQLEAELEEVQAEKEALENQLDEKASTVASLRDGIEELEEGRQMAEKEENEDASSNEEPHTHLVREGETLWDIASEYYGTGHEFRRIAEQNELENLDRLITGRELVIKN